VIGIDRWSIGATLVFGDRYDRYEMK